jgi:hypothetical protein
MIQKHDVNKTKTFKHQTLLVLLGYPVTCLKFYGNKEDLKVDHQKMLAATCKYDVLKN